MIALALVFTLAIGGAHAEDSRYGFVNPPYNYVDEFRRNEQRCPPWRPYLPEYGRCSGDDRPLGEDNQGNPKWEKL